jgi:hypothetical protein
MNFANCLVLSLLAIMGGFSYKENRALADKDRRVSHSRKVLDLFEALPIHFTESASTRRDCVADRDAAQIPAFELASSPRSHSSLAPDRCRQSPQEMRLGELETAVQMRLRLFARSIDLRRRAADDQKGQEAISEEGVNLTFHAEDRRGA